MTLPRSPRYFFNREVALALRGPSDALQYLRDRGFRRSVRKFFRTYVFARERMYVTYTDWVADAKLPLSMDGFEVRLARPDDPLAKAFPHLKPSTIANWLRPDHLFFVILHEGKLAGYRCVATGAGPALSRFFRLRPDQLFIVQLYTRPELRRLGLTRITKLAVARDVAARGFCGAFATEAPTNHATIISADRKGTLRVGTLTRTCLLGRVRFSLTPSTRLSPDLVSRQVALLRQVAPTVSHVGLLFNPSVVMAAPDTERATRAAAAELGTEITFLPVREVADQASAFDEAFSTAQVAGVDGLIVRSDPMMKAHRRTIVSVVKRHRLPAVFDAEEFVNAGGLMSYGAPAPCLRDIESLNAFVERVTTSGLPPPNLDDFRLVVNGRVATALGLGIPPALSPTTVP